MIHRVVIFSIVFVWSASMSAQDDETIGMAFPTEARTAWQQYVALVNRYEATTRSQLTDVLADEVRSKGGPGIVAVSGVWGLASGSRSRPYEPANRHWFASGANSTYSFELRRDHEDAQWRVERLEWITQDGTARRLEDLALPPKNPVTLNAENQNHWVRALCQGLMLSGIWFPSMIESPDFVLQSVENVESEGEVLVRVQFDYVPDDPFLTRVRGGFVLLDPNRYWLIREARTKGDWGDGSVGEIIISQEYDSSLDEIPLPTHRQEHWIGIMNDGESAHHVAEAWYDGWKRSSQNEVDFQLTAFGLPEPQPPQRRPRMWIWIAFHAVVGGCLAIWYFVRKRGTS